MPRTSYTSVIANTTDAEFTAWAKDLSDAIKSCLTQTTDTGQVDWSTTQTKPVSGSPFYEVYRFSDALQATAPMFLRVEYGSSSSNPLVKVTIGTATDGAGNLSGLKTAVTSLSNAPDPSPQTTYVCYKDGCFTLAFGANVSPSKFGGLVIVERTRDAAGNSTPDGALAVVTYASIGISVTTFSYARNTMFGDARIPCLTNVLLSAQSSSSAVVNLFNWFCFTPDIHNLTGAFTYKNAEIPQYSEIDAALVGGTSRHYLCLGTKYGNAWSMNGSSGIDVPAILWEE